MLLTKKSLVIAITLFALSVLPAVAQTYQPGSLMGNTIDASEAAGYSTANSGTGLATVVGVVVQTFLSLIGILFICYAIYGGFLWMTAAGSEEKVSRAKDILRNGIIGLVVVFSAAAIYYAAAAIFNPEFSNLGTF